MLRYLTVPVTAFQQNCSIVWCDETMKAAVIDPGGELGRLRAEVTRLGVRLEAIWLTHAHIDHAGAAGQWAREDGLPIVGLLLAGRIGRTDFPGGDFDTLVASITQRLWPMGDETVFVPGHGAESSFGAERRTNPFVARR